MGQILVAQGDLTQERLRQVIGSWLGGYMVDPSELPPDAAALALVPRAVAERESVLPLLAREDALAVLMADPLDRVLLDELRFLTQRRLVPVQAAPGTLLPAIARAYRTHPGTQPAASAARAPTRAAGNPPPLAMQRASAQELASDLTSALPEGDAQQADVVSESDNTLVRLINSVINEAIAHRASDIHIETEPAPQNVRIRLRVDGELAPYLELPARFRFAMVARIKIMASLDISEHRKPQDGKIDFARFGGPPVELRVVTVPTSHGLEDVVLRLLASAKPIPLEHIGLSPAHLQVLRAVVHKSYGLVLVCGPTGCGKTTTLHSVVSDINTEGRKIWTAEDPIEASLTGHLVLSTLHTNSAPESITRLLEMGLDPFNFSDSLLAILAQRLVRRLCVACRQPHPADNDTLLAMASQYLASGVQNTPEARAAQVVRWRSSYGSSNGGTVTLWQPGHPRADAKRRCHPPAHTPARQRHRDSPQRAASGHAHPAPGWHRQSLAGPDRYARGAGGHQPVN